MRRRRAARHVLPLVLALVFAGAVPQRAGAQYYSWGADAPMRWSRMHTPEQRIIVPDTALGLAGRMRCYMDAVRPVIGYGFTHGPLPVQVVMHPQNAQANGMVMFMPLRMEILSMPAVESYSMPWLKQLAAHEYRHAVQYSNLDRGVVRVLSRILGQQGAMVGLALMPLWALEGDAVMMETSASSFGRALQPSFTLGYRAMGRVGRDAGAARDRRNVDKWFCGSYLEYIPDHYQLGYQLNAYAYERYGENIWNRTARYAARNPYTIATTHFAFKKYYDTSVTKLFRETFDDLQRFWESLPAEESSAVPLTQLPERTPTTYRWPMPLGDTAVLAWKSDYARASRFVAIDRRTGAERHVAYTGSLSTRPAIEGDRVVWTEYRRSLLFDERVLSVAAEMHLSAPRPRARTLRSGMLLYPAFGDGTLGWIAYAPDGSYRFEDERGSVWPVPAGCEIHGLAWDDATRGWYVLTTDDDGMGIARIDDQGLHPVRPAAYVTLSDLRAEGGRLYFGSIASGKDEAHCFDLAEGREYRLTTSAYGSFAPAPAGDRLLVTTYDRRGYSVASQRLDTLRFEVAPSRIPENRVNPPRAKWPTILLDTVRFAPDDSLARAASTSVRRYRKGFTLFNPHSWAPISFDPFAAIEEFELDAQAGVTLLSQNLLSSTDAFASYGWSRAGGSRYRAAIRYAGLGVRLEGNITYGGGDQLVYTFTASDPETQEPYTPMPSGPRRRYLSAGLNASLPLYFQRGYHTRQLTLSAQWNYSNGLVAQYDRIERGEEGIANLTEIGFDEGLHKLVFGVSFSDQVLRAVRDLAPRWGYTLRASYTLNPTNDNFTQLLSLYGRVLLPGAARHHSLSVEANYQATPGGVRFGQGNAPLSYRSTQLIPHGFTSASILANDYVALSANYRLPLGYPDGGIPTLLYFKRISLYAGGDYAQFRSGGAQRRIWAVGGSLAFDFNFARVPSSGTSVATLSCYRPSEGKVWVGFSIGLPF